MATHKQRGQLVFGQTWEALENDGGFSCYDVEGLLS